MVTVRGAWAPNSSTNQRMRLRVDYTVPTPGPSDTSVTVTGSVWVEPRFGFTDSSNSFTMGGSLGPSASGSRSINVPTDGAFKLQDFTQAVPLTTSTQSRTVTASLTGIEYVGLSVTASVSATIQIPARAALPPLPPTDVGRTWQADNRILNTWSANPTSERPITGFDIRRHNYVLGVWAAVASVDGSARAWTETATTSNGMWRYGVRARNAAGVSGWVYSDEIRTTPREGLVSASRSGTSIVLTVQHRANFGELHGWQKQSSPDGGITWSAWSNIDGQTGLAMSVTESTVTGLDSGLAWRFRNIVTVTSPTLQGVSDATNTVHLLAPPLAPTRIAPNSVQSSQSAVLFRWRHNPTDASQQSAYRLFVRPVGGSATQYVGTTAQQRSVPISTPGIYEWWVETRGAHVDYSPASSVGVVEVADPPAVTIVSPTGPTYTSNHVVVDFAFHDPSGAAMVSWSAVIRDAGGQPVAARTGTGTRVTFPDVALTNETEYSVDVTALSGTGLTSAAATVAFTTEFTPPAPPGLVATWVEDQGLVSMTVLGTPPGWPAEQLGDGAYQLPVPVTYLGNGQYEVEGATVTHVGDGVYSIDVSESFTTAETYRVERSIDGGTTWQVIADGLPAGSGVIDTRVPLNIDAQYRAVAISDLDVEALSETVVVETTSLDVWLNAEDGTTAMLRLNMTIRHSHQHDVVYEHYMDDSGDGLPTAHFGTAHTTDASASGTIVSAEPDMGSPRHVWKSLLGQHVYWRDPHGEAWWAVLHPSGVDFTATVINDSVVSVTARKVHYRG